MLARHSWRRKKGGSKRALQNSSDLPETVLRCSVLSLHDERTASLAAAAPRTCGSAFDRGADVARSWRRCGSVLAQMWLGPGADVAGPLLLPRRQVAVMMRKGPFWGGRDNPAAIPRRRDPHGKPETAWTPLSLRGGPGLRRDGPGLRLGSRAGLQHGRSLPGGGRVHVRAAFWRDRFAYLERRRFQPEVCEDLQATACGTGPTFRRASGNGSTQGRA